MEDIKVYKSKNRAITCFDVVNFITSIPNKRINVSYFKGLSDYRIILTHGVVGEFIHVANNNFYGLDTSKIILLANNIEMCKFAQSRGVRSFVISENIFINDSLYGVSDIPGKGCILPARKAKLYNLDIDKIDAVHYEKSPQDSMPDIFKTFLCGLMTTEMEGSCRAVGEMLLSGLPIVNVRIASNSDRSLDNINTYSIVFNNTLGGRELWFNEKNCVYCERTESAINSAIDKVSKMVIDRHSIRSNFIDSLQRERITFLYVIKSMLDEINIQCSDYGKLINMPYSLNSINNDSWVSCIEHFKRSINE